MSATIADTTPYAWPYDGAFDPRRTALVVVTTVGENPPTDRSDPWGRVGDLAEAVSRSGGVVVHVATTAPDRRRGQAPTVPFSATTTLEAAGVDGFYASALDATLRSLGRDQLLLCGQWLETSVHSTLRSANDRGYECLLVLDACRPFDPELVAAARSQIEMSGGIFGAVGASADVLAAMPAPSTERQLP